MNIFTFKCLENERNAIQKKMLDLLHMHYLGSVVPKNKSENEEVYSDRLSKLIEESLCQFEDTDDGITLKFDTTEKAAAEIADKVYHASTEYYNLGLVYTYPLFALIEKAFPHVSFEAIIEKDNKIAFGKNHYSYQAKTLPENNNNKEHDEETMSKKILLLTFDPYFAEKPFDEEVMKLIPIKKVIEIEELTDEEISEDFDYESISCVLSIAGVEFHNCTDLERRGQYNESMIWNEIMFDSKEEFTEDFDDPDIAEEEWENYIIAAFNNFYEHIYIIDVEVS